MSPNQHRPSRSGSPGALLRFHQVEPLFSALHDPSQAVRTAALQALVRLPLAPPVWWRLTHLVLEWLNAPPDEAWIPVREVIRAAVYVPTVPVRQRLRDLLDQAGEDDRCEAAWALARARDPAALPHLVRDLSAGDDFLREQAAEHLAYLDVSSESEPLRALCAQDPNGNVRWWMAIALARAGEIGCLESLLREISAGDFEVPLLWGDFEMQVMKAIAQKGPFPEPTKRFLSQVAESDQLDPFARHVAADLAIIAGAIESGPEAPSPPEAPRDELQSEAQRLARHYIERSPLESERYFEEDIFVLAHLPPQTAHRLLAALLDHLAADADPDRRFTLGNYIIQWLNELRDRSFTVDIDRLFEVYLRIPEDDIHVCWQLAWLISRVGLPQVLEYLASHLSSADETGRLRAAQLLKDVILYHHDEYGPVFGGGAPPGEVLPAGELLAEPEPFAAARPPRRPPKMAEPEEPGTGPDRVVNTGFAAQLDPMDPLPADMPLSRNEAYYFWLEVGPPVAASIEETPVPLPVERLPERAILKVVLFPFAGEIQVTSGADVGELQLRDGGEVFVTRQPTHLPSVPVGAGLAARRLFFPVRTPPRAGTYRLRCSIYYQQVLVQSRLVRVQVMRAPKPSPRALRSTLDYALSRSLRTGQLAGMHPHRLSLMLNDNGDGTHAFRFYGREDFTNNATFDAHELQDLIDQARGALRMAAWGDEEEWREAKSYRYLGGRDLARLKSDLVRFAVRGYRFYDQVIDRLAGDRGPDELAALMRPSGQVQIAFKQSERFIIPAAMIYDYPLNTGQPEFELCQEFLNNLEAGVQLESTACFQGDCPSYDDTGVVCPGGFWGYRHVLGLPLSIGRHGLDLFPRILYRRQPRMVVGVSTDPDFKLRQAHETAIEDLSLQNGWAYFEGDERAEVIDLLRDGDPQFVYFYCHGGMSGSLPYIQVGPPTDMGITRDNLRAERIRWKENRPLVFINGCHTTALEPDKAFNFVSAFVTTSHASGVIGTEITVFEELARDFAESFLAHFQAGETVGQAVLAARLALLQAGNPLGLVYIPFALADLHLVEAGTA